MSTISLGLLAEVLTIQQFSCQDSLKSDRSKGSFSASVPGVFIQHYTVFQGNGLFLFANYIMLKPAVINSVCQTAE